MLHRIRFSLLGRSLWVAIPKPTSTPIFCPLNHQRPPIGAVMPSSEAFSVPTFAHRGGAGRAGRIDDGNHGLKGEGPDAESEKRGSPREASPRARATAAIGARASIPIGVRQPASPPQVSNGITQVLELEGLV